MKEMKIKVGYSSKSELMKTYNVAVYINTATYDKLVTHKQYLRACGPKQGICVIENYCDDVMEFFNSDKTKFEKIKDFICSEAYSRLNERITFEDITVESLKLVSGNLYINIQI